MDNISWPADSTQFSERRVGQSAHGIYFFQIRIYNIFRNGQKDFGHCLR